MVPFVIQQLQSILVKISDHLYFVQGPKYADACNKVTYLYF